MTVRVWVLTSAVIMVGVPAWCQSERLNDVAGTIKLDPTAVTEGGGTVVDPSQSRKADRELLRDVLDDGRAQARRLADLVAEARSSVLYREGDLLTRLTTASRDLEAAVQEIYSLRLTAPFEEPLEAARGAATTCERAAIGVREELERLGVAFTDAKEGIATCRRQIEEAAILLAGGEAPRPDAGRRATGGEHGAASGIDARIAELCGPEGSRSPDVRQSCLDRQYRALAALEARTAANEMLDQKLFDGLRKACGDRYPDDYAARNRCEQERMTAARLEAEAERP